MTLGTLVRFISSVSLVSVCVPAFASADFSKADSAELCSSVDGRYKALRGFTETTTLFVDFAVGTPGQPDVKEGYRLVKDASGFTQKNLVSFEMFELMAEPFGNAPKLRTEWKATFEELFDGPISIFDEKGTPVAKFDGSCNAAVVEFK